MALEGLEGLDGVADALVSQNVLRTCMMFCMYDRLYRGSPVCCLIDVLLVVLE